MTIPCSFEFQSHRLQTMVSRDLPPLAIFTAYSLDVSVFASQSRVLCFVPLQYSNLVFPSKTI